MKTGYTDISFILDRSGSMSSIKSDTEGGFNTFLAEQKKVDGECTVNLYQFDSHYEVVYENIPVADAPELLLTPRGNTALLDAIGRTVEGRGAYYATLAEDQRPEHVIMVIMTDGEENASKEYTLDMIKSMLEHQQDAYHWQVIYLGANQDAIKVGAQMGIQKDSTMSYATSAAGVGSSYASVSNSVSLVRSMGASVAFSDADRNASMGSK